MVAVDCVFRATRPTISPATTPLKVEPATIVPIIDGISGPPDSSAVNPSNTPRMPPSSIANTGLLIYPPDKLFQRRRAACVLDSAPHQQYKTHHDIRQDQQNRHFIPPVQAHQALGHRFPIRLDGILVAEPRQ